MDLRNHVKQILRMCGHAIVSTVHERLDQMERRSSEVEGSLLQASIHTIETLHRMTDAVVVETGERWSYTPELGLMEFLYSHVPTRTALDIGAYSGDVSAGLLDSGFEVYAFEWDPARFRRLQKRFEGSPDFHAFCLSVGEAPADAKLLPAEVTLTSRFSSGAPASGVSAAGIASAAPTLANLPVASRARLDDLHRAGLIPPDVSLVRIRTGVSDLDVLRGMGEHVYPVVVSAFRDAERSGGPSEACTVESLVGEMRSRGYPWHIVLYLTTDRNRVAFYSNVHQTVPNSLGSVFFFRDQNTFARAQDWCSAVLPPTYFRPARAASTRPEAQSAGQAQE